MVFLPRVASADLASWLVFAGGPAALPLPPTVNATTAGASSFAAPVWQATPPSLQAGLRFVDFAKDPALSSALAACAASGAAAISGPVSLFSGATSNGSGISGDPAAFIFVPLLAQNSTSGAAPLGFVGVGVDWPFLLLSVLPKNADFIDAVLTTSASPSAFTFFLSSSTAPPPWVAGDAHEAAFTSMGTSTTVKVGATTLTLRLYPTAAMQNAFVSNTKVWTTAGAGAIIAFLFLVFLAYDASVRRLVKAGDAARRRAAAADADRDARVLERMGAEMGRARDAKGARAALIADGWNRFG